MAKKLPLVVVLGATASGKSKLAIELARRFNGEIISADSMQVYQGLDIVTNKVTEDEQLQAKHHMIGIIKPFQRYTVIDFKKKALDIIDGLHKRDKLPIVVGGTNYYIESLIWKSFIMGSTVDAVINKGTKRTSSDLDQCEETTCDNIQETVFDREDRFLQQASKESIHSEEDLDDVDKFFSKHIYTNSLRDIKSDKLWIVLEKVDPRSAHLFHPNDRRRIIRSLQIYQERSETYSSVIKSLNIVPEDLNRSSGLGGPLRFENTCVLWLDFAKDELNKILDDRIDAMLNRGLLAELEIFYRNYVNQKSISNESKSYSQGIFQTIGFKEFHQYFLLDEEVRESDEGNKILRQCIENMKIATRQYARRQLKWINRRFTFASSRVLPKLYKLDSSFDNDVWLNQVQGPSFDLVQALIDDKTSLSERAMACQVTPTEATADNEPGKLHCEACDKLFIGSNQIQSHLLSKQHKKMVKLFESKKTPAEKVQLEDHTQRTEA